MERICMYSTTVTMTHDDRRTYDVELDADVPGGVGAEVDPAAVLVVV